MRPRGQELQRRTGDDFEARGMSNGNEARVRGILATVNWFMEI
jgi:hypothetical protein